MEKKIKTNFKEFNEQKKLIDKIEHIKFFLNSIGYQTQSIKLIDNGLLLIVMGEEDDKTILSACNFLAEWGAEMIDVKKSYVENTENGTYFYAYQFDLQIKK